MKIKVPDYFIDFKCIADKCLDSCCIGWEIDIDNEARAKYDSLDTPIGAEIREKTSHGYFPLSKNGRCAFLDDTGLCRIISSLGEGYLCDICREHPRYYGVGGGGIEGGLGLGCEEAARMILSLEKLPRIIEIERDIPYSDEDEYSRISDVFRNHLSECIFKFDINELAGIYKTYAEIADEIAFEVTSTKRLPPIPKPMLSPLDSEELGELVGSFLDLFSECEALTEDWHSTVALAKEVEIEKITEKLGGIKGVLYYFTHRYVREGVEDLSLGQRILFALLSSLAVAAISISNSSCTDVTSAVLFSKNIEYSTDNVDMLLDSLTDYL